MATMTYTVVQSGDEWAIHYGQDAYTGYKSEAGATKAAIAVASKLGRNGHETFVVIQAADGTTRSVFASDPEPPTVDSMMNAAR